MFDDSSLNTYIVFLLTFLISLVLTPLFRNIYIKFNTYDIPNELKKHAGKIPHSGGMSVFISFIAGLIILRFTTHFPTGTLRELRYILAGCFLIFLIGIIDDIKKPLGIKAEIKFIIEFFIAIFMVSRGFSINFIQPDYLSWILSILWIVGITNALNIIDIMDGLAASQVIIASFAFYFITLPQEEIYVNLLSGILAFSVLGFLPFNMSKNRKVFMGDSGSLLCGFVLSIISLGARYSNTNPVGVYAPLFILSVPLFDTLYVSYLRIKKGISPLKGSRDHFALRLEAIGYSRLKIVIVSTVFSVIMAFLSFLLTKLDMVGGIILFIFVTSLLICIARYLSKVRVI